MLPWARNRFAHGLVKKRGDNAAVQVAGMAFESIGDDREADNRAIVREQEFKVEAAQIRRPRNRSNGY
ncbi:MAG: hypothetical protein WDM87_18680 [Terracidiphilus sp.]